jgi:hypothetical protein
MLPRIRIRLLMGMIGLLGVCGSAQAQLNTLSYFETQLPGACTAASPTNRGTFIRQYLGASGQCPGLTVYHVVKGGNTYPWGTESFYVSNGYLLQMMEISINESTGTFTDYRAFRDMTTGSKGIRWIATSIPSNGTAASWNVPYYVEEHWTNDSGQPVCYNTRHAWVDNGSLTDGAAWYVGAWSGWLQDKRASSLNKNTWHNVNVIVKRDRWGGNYEEFYYYAQWQNPATGTYQGLGLVKWEWYQRSPRTLIASNENHYLVDCSAAVTCWTCPP